MAFRILWIINWRIVKFYMCITLICFFLAFSSSNAWASFLDFINRIGS
jgi:hypothetical protein